MKTRITELLGIEYPIFQGDMAYVADGNLAGAVSAAGGLGIIGSGGSSGEWVAEQIAKVRSVTDNPFGVNIMMLSKNIDEIVDVIIDSKVPVVTIGVGTPDTNMIRKLSNAGIIVIPLVSSVDEAIAMYKAGADAVIAEGQESGGHVKEMTTMALVPAVCDAVDIPVIAAGGIADGRGMVAAFALGAEGIQMGTRFLTANKCTIDDEFKRRVLQAGDSGTVVTGRLRNKAVRQLKGDFACKMIGLEEGLFEGDDIDLHEIHTGSLKKAALEGNTEMGCFMSGQITSLVNDRKSASDIVRGIMREAESCGGRNLQEMADINANRSWR